MEDIASRAEEAYVTDDGSILFPEKVLAQAHLRPGDRVAVRVVGQGALSVRALPGAADVAPPVVGGTAAPAGGEAAPDSAPTVPLPR
ncbi:hypothetical protein ACQEU5_07545 [Marinactinospora thermotolerans]|uniref:SpoVT-AbrB domain-containing protein n=1 Tax=Marinactinospora thermotolerans DSM 45154 TaxID=1122192 RepID=A0A1T4R4C0_9ACTN|nr:hypothetical protein [Marinactinospora thermotolerans]SKA10783.1 hypothetical protein SAMN02745673_02515 [Marinactinospora thermotolerans DSM 45154]